MAESSPKLPTWYRALAVVVGVLSLALALVVLVDPLLAVWLLIFLLALGLLFMGMDRLIAGITGHPFSVFWVASVKPGPEVGTPTGPGPGGITPPTKPQA